MQIHILWISIFYNLDLLRKILRNRISSYKYFKSEHYFYNIWLHVYYLFLKIECILYIDLSSCSFSEISCRLFWHYLIFLRISLYGKKSQLSKVPCFLLSPEIRKLYSLFKMIWVVNLSFNKNYFYHKSKIYIAWKQLVSMRYKWKEKLRSLHLQWALWKSSLSVTCVFFFDSHHHNYK